MKSALTGGAVIGVMAATKYNLKNRKEYKQLLKRCDGDPEKLAKLKTTIKGKGMAGDLMTEMMRTELHDDIDDDEQTDIGEATRKANKAQLVDMLEEMRVCCLS